MIVEQATVYRFHDGSSFYVVFPQSGIFRRVNRRVFDLLGKVGPGSPDLVTGVIAESPKTSLEDRTAESSLQDLADLQNLSAFSRRIPPVDVACFAANLREFAVNVHPVRDCNFGCVYCFASDGHRDTKGMSRMSHQ
ncbi:MAG: hypothetical protein ABIH23_27405, partial [bacterium]